jgi:ribosomal protein S18 acetylase RimI-like enzyme
MDDFETSKHISEAQIHQIPTTRGWLVELLKLDRIINQKNPAYHIDNNLEDFQEFMDSQPNCANYALTQASRLIGYITLADARPAQREVANLGIHPRYQGQGYGRLLLEFAEAQTREAGTYTGMRLLTSVDNPAQKFYEHMGYERIEVIEDYDGHGDPGYLFVKALSDPAL